MRTFVLGAVLAALFAGAGSAAAAGQAAARHRLDHGDRGQQRPLHQGRGEGGGRDAAGKSRSSTRRAAPIRPMPASRISSSAAPRRSSTWCSRSARSAPASPRRTRAKIPVVTWGGGLGGSVIATNGSRRPDGRADRRDDGRRISAARATCSPSPITPAKSAGTASSSWTRSSPRTPTSR